MYIQSILNINTLCNSRCIGCDFWKKGSMQLQLDINDITKFVNYAKSIGMKQIMISGGEPLLHSNIVEVVKMINLAKINIMFNTNGILLKEKIDKIAPYVGHIVISMDSSNREGYLKIRGVDKFYKIIEAIKYVREKYPKIIITLRITVMKYNLNDIFNIARLAESLGCRVGINPVDTFSDNFLRSNLDEIDVKNLIPNNKEINEFLNLLDKDKLMNVDRPNDATWTRDKFKKLTDYFKDINEGKLFENGTCACTIPYTGIILEANGDLKRCFYSKPIVNIKEIRDIKELEKICKLKSIKDDIAAIEKSGICHGCRTKFFS